MVSLVLKKSVRRCCCDVVVDWRWRVWVVAVEVRRLRRKVVASPTPHSYQGENSSYVANHDPCTCSKKQTFMNHYLL